MVWRVEVCGVEGGGVWYGGWRCVVWRVKYYIGIGSVEKMERRVCCMCVCEEWSVEGEGVCLTTLEIVRTPCSVPFL